MRAAAQQAGRGARTRRLPAGALRHLRRPAPARGHGLPGRPLGAGHAHLPRAYRATARMPWPSIRISIAPPGCQVRCGRLGVAQALIHDPRVLLLDEPYAGLAPEERARLRTLLTETAIDRLVVFATRRPDDVEAVCTRVAVLEEGKLRYLGAPQDMVARAAGQGVPRRGARGRAHSAAPPLPRGQRRFARPPLHGTVPRPHGCARHWQGRPPRHTRRLSALPAGGAPA